MTEFINLMQAAQRVLRERRGDVLKHKPSTIFVSNKFVDALARTPPIGIRHDAWEELVAKLANGDCIQLRGIPIYLDKTQRAGFVVLEGPEASQRMKAIRERKEAIYGRNY